MLSLSIVNFAIGGTPVEKSDVSALTIGGYPSPHWKVQYKIPVPTKKSYPVGPVTFEIKGVNNVGNQLLLFTDKDANAVVVVE